MRTRVIATGVIEKNGCILFGKKPKGVGPYPDRWLFPGGGIRLGKETAVEGLRRELREEANIELKDIEAYHFSEDFAEKGGEMIHHIFLIFTAKYESGNMKAKDDLEVLKWISKDQVKNIKDELPRPSVHLFEKMGLF